ncbi:MAG: hypothetical protein LC122_13940 [Chitinophagales bacterium]|nr:hypothetical protein [Chitinophagales bacterium]
MSTNYDIKKDLFQIIKQEAYATDVYYGTYAEPKNVSSYFNVEGLIVFDARKICKTVENAGFKLITHSTDRAINDYNIKKCQAIKNGQEFTFYIYEYIPINFENFVSKSIDEIVSDCELSNKAVIRNKDFEYKPNESKGTSEMMTPDQCDRDALSYLGDNDIIVKDDIGSFIIFENKESRNAFFRERYNEKFNPKYNICSFYISDLGRDSWSCSNRATIFYKNGERYKGTDFYEKLKDLKLKQKDGAKKPKEEINLSVKPTANNWLRSRFEEGALQGMAASAVKFTQQGIVAAMKKSGKDNFTISVISDFLESEAGVMLISAGIGSAIHFMPMETLQKNDKVQKIADKCMENVAAKGVEQLSELAMNFILPALMEATNSKELELFEAKNNIRVKAHNDEPELDVSDLVEYKDQKLALISGKL